jgi:hypothetical protein
LLCRLEQPKDCGGVIACRCRRFFETEIPVAAYKASVAEVRGPMVALGSAAAEAFRVEHSASLITVP